MKLPMGTHSSAQPHSPIPSKAKKGTTRIKLVHGTQTLLLHSLHQADLIGPKQSFYHIEMAGLPQ